MDDHLIVYLEKQIVGSRKMSDDGSVVIYDFSRWEWKPKTKGLGKVLAKVLFEMDAKKWFAIIDNEINFLPDYKVIIKFADRKGMRTNSIEENYLKYLRSEQVLRYFQKQIDSAPGQGASFGTFFAFGAGGAVLEEITNSSNATQAFISHIMEYIRGNVSFQYDVS